MCLFEEPEINLGEVLGSDRLQDLVDGGVGQRSHLLVGAVLDWVGDEDPGRVEAEGVGLRPGGVDELGRRDEDTG